MDFVYNFYHSDVTRQAAAQLGLAVLPGVSACMCLYLFVFMGDLSARYFVTIR